MTRSRSAGFTLIEVLVVVIVLGLLTSLVIGGFSNVVPAGWEAAAVNKARVINAARVSYSLTVPDASTQWAGCGTDADKSALLVNAGLLTGNPGDWLAASGGYTLSLTGGLKNKTVLRKKSGTALNYTD